MRSHSTYMLRIVNAIVFVFFLTMSPVLGQLSFDEINYENIPFQKVVSYIESQQKLANATTLRELEPTCMNTQDFSGFRTYEKRYVVKKKLTDVWSTYKNASPTDAWTTKKSSIGLLYLRNEDALRYSNDTCNGIRPGQMLYMNLRLVKGLYHLATAFEITKVESESGTIEVNYVESGINEGKQVITMVETPEGYTEIIHQSMIRSDSKFRDLILYPYFHNKLINAFHKKMKKLIFSEAESTVSS